MIDRPLPVPTLETEPFWSGLKERRLLIPHCRTCGTWHFYPKPMCPDCRSEDLEWSEASGDATLFSYSVVQRAPSEKFRDEVPYTVALVTLAEGPHMMSRIVGAGAKAPEIGSRLKLTFVEFSEGNLPMFELAQA